MIVNDYAHINGGASKVALGSAPHLAAAGLRVHLFAGAGPISSELEGVTVTCLEETPFQKKGVKAGLRDGLWNLRARGAFEKVLAECNPAETVVHVHTHRDCLSASVPSLAIEKGFSVLFTAHEYYLGCPYGTFFDQRQHIGCPETGLSIGCLMRRCNDGSYAKKVFAFARQKKHAESGIPGRLHHVAFVSDFSERILAPYLGPETKRHRLDNPVDVDLSTPSPLFVEDSDLRTPSPRWGEGAGGEVSETKGTQGNETSIRTPSPLVGRGQGEGNPGTPSPLLAENKSLRTPSPLWGEGAGGEVSEIKGARGNDSDLRTPSPLRGEGAGGEVSEPQGARGNDTSLRTPSPLWGEGAGGEVSETTGVPRPFLFVGTLHPGKDPLTFAHAAREAGVPAIFVGRGDLDGAIREANPDAEVLGWVNKEELHVLYQRAGALVFPPIWPETQGLAVFEAAAFGVPSIVTETCAARDFVEKNQAGWLVKPADVKGMAKLLRRFSQNPAELAEAGARAHAAFWQNPPTMERYVQEATALYAKILAGRTNG